MRGGCFNLLLLISVFVSCFLVVSSSGDAEILIRVKETLFGDPDGKLRDWVVAGGDRSPCNWTGITCDPRTGSVVAINISGFGLSGGFPFGFCRIRTLWNLTLVDNNLNGTLASSSLSLCTHLRVLILTRNSFSGSLPEFWREFRQLRVLVLESNEFSGEIPASYGKFPALRELNLNANQLTGTIPAFLGNLSKLNRLELSFISFEPGPIPSSIGNLTKLNFLRLTDAKLIGEIPEEIGNLVFLENLDLAMNALSGKIPDSIGRLKSIYQIVLYDNRLSEELPESIGNLSSLRNFDVSQNNLTGNLPEKIAALRLQSFNLNDNFFTGEIPEILALNPNLVQLKIFNNSFIGKLPENLGRFSDLDEFDVSTNKFSGKLPPYLCYRKKLRQIITFKNQFTGDIPKSYGDCDLLSYVRMADNNLSGRVPIKFWSLPLTRLELSNNQFEGSVAPSISHAHTLTQLDISGNIFSCEIPAKICDLRDLSLIDMSRNRFSGPLPPCITKLKKLESVRLQENTLDGEIPNSVSSWTELTELNFSNNVFSGEIPPQLGNLPVLNYLDLSNNKLSSEIPVDLTKLKLNQFNVSNNKLSGRVPSGFQHKLFISSLLGNPGLCSPDLDPVPRCGSKPATPYILAIAAMCIVILIGSLVWLFAKTKPLFQRKLNLRYNVTTFQRVGFSEEDILPYLTEENVIGSGGSGRVYKVSLKSGQTLAVKKLWVGLGREPEIESGFRSEVETLGRVRHGNILKLLMCCSGGDFKILVYEFMEKGSLGGVLHGEKGCPVVSALDWTTRFSIAMGAAQGLVYLHHDCVPAIIHRDVKSNNILLDEEMKPHVADFGLAKTLERADRDDGAMSRVAGSYGYIAPEYAYTLKVNEKSDVYSFGVVLLELITGKRPNDLSFGEDKDIVKFVMQAALSSPSSLSPDEVNDGFYNHSRGLDELIDPRMERSDNDYEEIERVVDVALLCTSSFPINRPPMKRVVELLREKKPK